MHLSTLWRNALFSTLKYLRQNVLKDTKTRYGSTRAAPWAATSPSPRSTLQTLRVCTLMPRKNLRQTWGRYHAHVERNIERAHARGKARGIVENWERGGSEGSLGGVNSGVCISVALDLLTGTLRPRIPFLRNNSLRMWS